VLLIEAQRRLFGSQTSLGEIMGGLSRKTISRYQCGNGRPHPTHIHPLVRRLHPVDPVLAEKLAAFSGTTLEALGLVEVKPARPEPSPASAPAFIAAARASDERQVRLLVDAVLCAAANALDVPPRSVRGVLFAAFSQAKETGLSLDALVNGLAPSRPSTPRRKRRKRSP